MPWRKLLVPSSGSMIHRGLVGSPSIVPPSSSSKPQSGRATRSSSHSVRSDAWSALETKSEGPLRLTWRCATSPKSRRSRPPALRAARSIMRINPETAANLPFQSVERDADRAGGDLDLAPATRKLELLPIAGDGIEHAVILVLAVDGFGLVDLEVVDVGKANVADAKAPGLARFR